MNPTEGPGGPSEARIPTPPPEQCGKRGRPAPPSIQVRPLPSPVPSSLQPLAGRVTLPLSDDESKKSFEKTDADSTGSDIGKRSKPGSEEEFPSSHPFSFEGSIEDPSTPRERELALKAKALENIRKKEVDREKKRRSVSPERRAGSPPKKGIAFDSSITVESLPISGREMDDLLKGTAIAEAGGTPAHRRLTEVESPQQASPSPPRRLPSMSSPPPLPPFTFNQTTPPPNQSLPLFQRRNFLTKGNQPPPLPPNPPKT